MIRQSLGRVWMVGIIAVGLLVSANPALAQALGSLRGTVVDETGAPIADAEVVLKYLGDMDLTIELKANGKGEFIKTGLRTGEWQLKATKGELSGMQNAKVMIQQMIRVEPLVLKAGSATATDTSDMSAKEVEARNKLMASMQAEFDAAVAGIETDPAASVAAFNNVAAQIPDCAICYAKIGNAQIKLGDEAAAEAAYKKAIELKPDLVDPYSALAVLYNSQKKFDDATTMSQKANELMGTSATGGDPATVFNQGIIYWNQGGKTAEAKAEFEKAIALDPMMADAHYWLGMANLNLGQLPDAGKAFQEYLKVAPDGQYAEMVKGILKEIIK